MSSASGSTWLVVDDSNNHKPRRQVSENNLRAPRSLDFVSVSPQELQQQQELLDHYKTKQRLERIHERSYPAESSAESSQQPAITPSGFRRRLESLPCVMKITSHHSKMITTSSTGATVGVYVPPEGPAQVSAPPPARRRRKHTAPQPPLPGMLGEPIRATTGPAYLQPSSKPGLLNVNTIGGSSPPMPVPQLPHYHSAPAAIQTPLVLPLESLPPGYDFAIAQFRSENTLRPLRLLSLGESHQIVASGCLRSNNCLFSKTEEEFGESVACEY